MKAEIYSIVDKSFNPKSLDKKMNVVTNNLKEADIEILYKTDLEDDKIQLLEALRQSYSTDEGIQLIIIANALDGTPDCDTIALFKKLCPKHTEKADDFDEDAEEEENISEYKYSSDLDDLADSFESEKRKKNKSGSKKDGKLVYEIWSAGDLGRGMEGCFILYDEKLILALPKESLTKVSTSDMIIAGAKKATSARGITTGKLVGGKVTDHFDYYEIAQEEEEVEEKKGFLSGIFPSKGDKPLETVRKVVLIAATLTFIVTAVILVKLLFVEPAQVEKKYDDLREIAHPVKVNDPNTDAPAADPNEPGRFDKLQAINPEIMGWIYIPKTTYIDYPVLEHKGDNDQGQYYLHRDYKGNGSSYGSVFIDYRCTKSINSKNIILHGHNMDNGQVFHQLLSYSDINFYRSTPVIQFDTPEYDADWKIISVFKTNTLTEQGEFFNYLRGEFDTETDFMDFVYNILERSLIDTGVTVNEDDQLLTLSTCSYEMTNFRTVIVARRVRRGEDSKVDTSKAAMNPDAVWPQAWYARTGGQRKELTDFGTACRAGQTPWYDGDYKLDKKDIRKVKVIDTDREAEEREEQERREQEEQERLEREEEERLESERAESERLESERIESERAASEKAASEKAEQERREEESRRAEEQRRAAEQAAREEAERQAAQSSGEEVVEPQPEEPTEPTESTEPTENTEPTEPTEDGGEGENEYYGE